MLTVQVSLQLTRHQYRCGAACSLALKLLHLDTQGGRFNPWCGHDKIRTAVGPSSEALNPTSLRGGGGIVACLVESTVSHFG